jgi:hypothetical protein
MDQAHKAELSSLPAQTKLMPSGYKTQLGIFQKMEKKF